MSSKRYLKDPLSKMHFQLSLIGVIFCFVFVFWGAWIQSKELLSYFGVYLVGYSLSLWGAFRGSSIRSRVGFVLLISSGIFIVSELMGDRSDAHMVFLVEMYIIHYLFQKNATFRHLLKGLVAVLFGILILPGNVLLTSLKLPSFYVDTLNYSLLVASMLGTWLILTAYFSAKESKNESRSYEPEPGGALWKAINLRMLSPLETLLATQEMDPEVVGQEEREFIRTASHSAIAELRGLQTKLKSLFAEGAAKRKMTWNKVNPYQFLHRFEMRLDNWGLGGQFEFYVDESIHFREVKLPDELLYEWLGDWLKTLGELPPGGQGRIELSFRQKRVYLKCQGQWNISWENARPSESSENGHWLSFAWEALKADCQKFGIEVEGGLQRGELFFCFAIPSELSLMEYPFQLPQNQNRVKGILRGLSLLLVQRDSTLGRLNKMRLEHLGADVYWAQEGDEAIKNAAVAKVDALIVDPIHLGTPLNELYYRLKLASARYGQPPPLFLWCEENELSEELSEIRAHWDSVIVRPANFMDIASKLHKLNRRVKV